MRFLIPKNKSFRNLLLRVFQTVFLYYHSFITIGYYYTITSITINHLRILTGTTISEISILFTFRGIGLIPSSLIAGYYYTWYARNESMKNMFCRTSHNKIIPCSLLIIGVILVAIPFSSSIWLIYLFHFYEGISSSVIEIGCYIQLAGIWRDFPRVFFVLQQGIQFIFGLGCFIFPIIVAQIFKNIESVELQLHVSYYVCAFLVLLPVPFLWICPTTGISIEKEREECEESSSSESSNCESCVEKKSKGGDGDESETTFSSENTSKLDTFKEDFGSQENCEENTEKTSNSNDDTDEEEKSVLDGFPRTIPQVEAMIEHGLSLGGDDSDFFWKKKRYLLLKIFGELFTVQNLIYFLTAILKCTGVGLHIAYSLLLFQYGSRRKMGSDGDLAYMTSLFFISFSLSRLFMIFLGLILRPGYILMISFIGSWWTFLVFLFFEREPVAVWVCTCLFGLFSSPISASLLLFPQSAFGIPLTSYGTSFLMFGQYIGECFMPTLASLLCDDNLLGNHGFGYFCFVVSSFSLGFYVLLLLVGYLTFGKSKKNDNNSSRIEFNDFHDEFSEDFWTNRKASIQARAFMRSNFLSRGIL